MLRKVDDVTHLFGTSKYDTFLARINGPKRLQIYMEMAHGNSTLLSISIIS